MTQTPLLQTYHEAVSEAFAFLYTNMMVRDKGKMFMNTSEEHVTPSSHHISY